VLELKYDQDADTATNQIKQKNYPERVVPYTKNLLLVGINYDKQQKTHLCKIEKL
jgi:epoxyqueuosine reductase QueG